MHQIVTDVRYLAKRSMLSCMLVGCEGAALTSNGSARSGTALELELQHQGFEPNPCNPPLDAMMRRASYASNDIGLSKRPFTARNQQAMSV